MSDYQLKAQPKFRWKHRYSIGFIISCGEIVWTGKWFKKVLVEEQQYKERYRKFDDGWSYNFYWSHWKKVWKFKRLG